jgi:Fe-S cluster assembly ATP-binding protein
MSNHQNANNETRKANGQEEMPANEMLKVIVKNQNYRNDRKFLRSLRRIFRWREKRNEIFQMAMLEPKLAILDETDSGLDIDVDIMLTTN